MLSRPPSDLFEEPGDQRSQDEWVVGLSVVERKADATGMPQVPLPAVQVPSCGADVKQDHVGTPLDQPAAKVNLQQQSKANPEKVYLQIQMHWKQIAQTI